MEKKILSISLVLTAILLGGCIINLPILMLSVVALLCVAIIFLNLNEATCLLFYFSPLSYLLVYNQYSIYILVAVAYIMAILLKKKNAIGVLSSFFLLAYCFIFADFSASINIGRFIYPILLMLLIFVCQFTEKKNYKTYISFFLLGFIVSAIVGFFKDQIPMIQSIFTSDALYIDGVETSMNIIRYSGLSYDPNFFALIDCILISILLFNEKKLSIIKGISIIFLIVVGFFTFSKSYVILLAIIGIAYVLKNNKKPLRTLSLVAVAFICLLIAENYSEIKILSLIEARFTNTSGANDLTTGRLDLWIEYLNYISKNIWCLLFGEGFNALSLGKAVHNTYIDFVYRFGLFGTTLWIGYFVWCKKYVDRIGNKKTSFNMAGLVFILGIFFLSAFHFQQLWCCIYFVLIAPYSDGGKDEEIKCNSTYI